MKDTDKLIDNLLRFTQLMKEEVIGCAFTEKIVFWWFCGNYIPKVVPPDVPEHISNRLISVEEAASYLRERLPKERRHMLAERNISDPDALPNLVVWTTHYVFQLVYLPPVRPGEKSYHDWVWSLREPPLQ